MYINIYTYVFAEELANMIAAFHPNWVFIKGGCSRRGVQWMGVVLHNKTAFSIIQIPTPCFHCNPL